MAWDYSGMPLGGFINEFPMLINELLVTELPEANHSSFMLRE